MILDPTGAVQSVVKVGSNPAQVIIAPAGTPRAGTAYVLSQGNGEVEKGSVTVIPPTGQPQQITTAVNPTAMAIAQPGAPTTSPAPAMAP